MRVIHESSRTTYAAQTAKPDAAQVASSGSAIVALSTAIVEPQMRTAEPDVSQLLVHVHS